MMKIYSGDAVYTIPVTGFDDQFSKSVNHTPIPSLPPAATFGLEVSNRLRYSVSFSRKQPVDPDDSSPDSTRWNNSTWLKRVSTLVERWQARTDGYPMSFTGHSDYPDPDAEFDPYIYPSNTYMPRHLGYRVYLLGMTVTFGAGWSDTFDGNIMMAVGGGISTARTGIVTKGDGLPGYEPLAVGYWGSADGFVKDRDFLAYLRVGGRVYYLQSRIRTAVSTAKDWERDDSRYVDSIGSYTIEGGPESPFECCRMKISRKRLVGNYPDLVNGNPILPGSTMVTVRGVGGGTFIVTNVRSSKDEYTVTAYCRAETLRGMTLASETELSPLGLIRGILLGEVALDGGNMSSPRPVALFKEEDIISNVEELMCEGEPCKVTFSKGISAWAAVQLGSMALNARIFFANDRAYIIDYTVLAQNGGTKGVYFPELFDLGSTGNRGPLHDSLSGMPEFDQNGSDVLYNYPAVTYRDGGDKEVVVTPAGNRFMTLPGGMEISCEEYSKRSTAVYPTYCRKVDLAPYIRLNVLNNQPELIEAGLRRMDVFSEAVSRFYLAYRGEPQSTTEFVLSERGVENGETFWTPTFPIVSATGGFRSESDDVEFTDRSTVLSDEGVSFPQKMALTRYVRHYPERTTEYTFGEQTSTDLASTTSQILRTLG